jgi:hypothetical protein
LGPNRAPHHGQRYCAGGRAGGVLQAGRAVAGDWGKRTTSRARRGRPRQGPFAAIFARRLMESCKPMASRPAPRCSRISGWLQRAEDKGAQGARSPNFPKWALEYLRLRCTAAQRQNGCVGQSQQWTRLPTACFPVMGPQTTPTSAGPCFLQDSMHGDSYPCCRQSIRLCLPAYSSKALTDIKIAGELLRALSRW